MTLGDRRWPEVVLAGVLAVPVGSIEQHGPHLPLDTDTRIAVAVAAAVPGGMSAPAVAYGASGEHEGFAGTVSIGHEALTDLLVEFGRSVPGADAHAGRTETSLLLAIAPEHVRLADAVAGNTEPIENLMSRLRTGGIASVSPSGVLGDPTGADALEGQSLLDDMRQRFALSVVRWTPNARAVLT